MTEDEEKEKICAGMGKVALAGAQAEKHFADAIAFLLTDRDEEVTGRLIGQKFRSLRSLTDLLCLALPETESIGTIASAVRDQPSGKHVLAEPIFADFTHKRPCEYVEFVYSRYDKRNRCIHAQRFEIKNNRLILLKPGKNGEENVTARTLLDGSALFGDEHCSGLWDAMELLAVELELASAAAWMLVRAVRDYRERDLRGVAQLAKSLLNRKGLARVLRAVEMPKKPRPRRTGRPTITVRIPLLRAWNRKSRRLADTGCERAKGT